ncbi:phosphatidylglycerophosphatase [Spizellomyces sp. 'palustris']|nr:phosphatidylglycerophosphatase [Spizellomyces sp. 'palustris']
MVQSLNFSSLASIGKIVRSPSLLIPHLSVPDIRYINFKALQAAGIRAVVFDKDNTITAPYVEQVHPAFDKSWKSCKDTFGQDRVLIVSNSAGTPDDVGHKKAATVEAALGVPVLRHTLKKPAGGDILSSYFGCPSHCIAVVGDRAFTDIVYGNLNGMLTVHVTKIVTEEGDNKIAALIRKLEYPLVNWLRQRGLSPPHHSAFEKHNPQDFVRES